MSVHQSKSLISTPWGEQVEELVGSATPGSTSQHSVARITVPPGVVAPTHYHPIAEESYTVISGSGTVFLDGIARDITIGDCVAIPPNVRHSLSVPKDAPGPLVMIVVCSPPWNPDCSVFVDTA